MWCVLTFGVAFPSLRFQHMTIREREANARRMSILSNLQYTQNGKTRPSAYQILLVRSSNTLDNEISGAGFKRFNTTIYGGVIDKDFGGDSPPTDTEKSYSTEPSWPQLDNLIEKTSKKIITDVQFILDFAIIAHPKTATSNMQNWFRSHPEIQMHENENHALAVGNPAELVSNLYDLKPGWTYKRGYKAPRDLIISESLHAIDTYWPMTKLIVGLRHPVLWFESFYNFRVHNGHKMPPPAALIGKLKRGMVGVATDEAKFHLHLDNLGKTSHSPDELKLLAWGHEKKVGVRRMRNPVFLYEVNQLRDINETRAAIFSSDLKNYLGLKNDYQPISTKRGPKYNKAIEICESNHTNLRQELMKNSRESSIWIRKYFLHSPDVRVSSPDHFNALLVSWMVDPCTM